MPKSCPKCNRPVRTGANYCGFCGANLLPAGAGAAPAAAKSEATCPHCGAPLRAGATACVSCGKLLSTPPSAVTAPIPALAHPAAPAGPSAEMLARRARRNRQRLLLSLAVVLVICLAIVIPLAFFGQPLLKDLLTRDTPTSTATETALPTPTRTRTALPSATPLPSTTPTQSPTPTATSLPSATPTRLMPPTYTATPLALLLRDDFSQPLGELWQSWGRLNTTVTEGANPALLITAQDVEAGGISTLSDQVRLAPGVVINFTADVAALDNEAAVLRFAWSPETVTIPELEAGLPVALLIDAKQLTVEIAKEDGSIVPCVSALEGAAHTFRIEIGAERLPVVLVDGSPVCETSLVALIPTSLPGGRIHFSGSGVIDDFYVSRAP